MSAAEKTKEKEVKKVKAKPPKSKYGFNSDDEFKDPMPYFYKKTDINDGVVYKYYTELNKDEQEYYECSPVLDPGIGVWQAYMQERGNMLGVSIPNVNQWVLDILKQGKVKDNQNNEEVKQHQNECLLKVYDKSINSFKLNEQVTLIGVLEFKVPEEGKEGEEHEVEGNTLNFN